MTAIEALEARVDRLESRAGIRELVTKYAVACDEHDIPKLQNLFTEVAVLKSPVSLSLSLCVSVCLCLCLSVCLSVSVSLSLSHTLTHTQHSRWFGFRVFFLAFA